MNNLVLVVEDDKYISNFINMSLKQEGYGILSTINGNEALNLFYANNPDIVIIIGLYNSKTSEYQRFTEIQTSIFQVKTFSLMTMDLAGNHTNTLVCTGFSSNNDSILQAYNPKTSKNRFSLVKIIDLKTDGTIFIQQAQRNDNYSIYNMNAECFPIIMYSTEETPEGTDF